MSAVSQDVSLQSRRGISCGVFTKPDTIPEVGDGASCFICTEAHSQESDKTQLTWSKAHDSILHLKCMNSCMAIKHECPLCREIVTSVNGTPLLPPQQPQAQEDDAAFLAGARLAIQRNRRREQVIHNVALGHALAPSNVSNPMSKKLKALYVFLISAIICSLILIKVITIVPFIVLIIMFIALLLWHLMAPCREDREIAMNEYRQHLRQPILREVE